MSTDTPGFCLGVLNNAIVNTASIKLANAPPWITCLAFIKVSSTLISIRQVPSFSGAEINFH